MEWNNGRLLYIPWNATLEGKMAVDEEALFHDLVRLQIELWNAVDAELKRKYDLSLAWYEPMNVIAQTPACRVLDIAAELSITVGGVSKLVDRIEKVGYCVRVPNLEDGRSSALELTIKGKKILSMASQTVRTEISKLLKSTKADKTLEEYSKTTKFLLRTVREHQQADLEQEIKRKSH